jgi:hypothetical protein
MKRELRMCDIAEDYFLRIVFKIQVLWHSYVLYRREIERKEQLCKYTYNITRRLHCLAASKLYLRRSPWNVALLSLKVRVHITERCLNVTKDVLIHNYTFEWHVCQIKMQI